MAGGLRRLPFGKVRTIEPIESFLVYRMMVLLMANQLVLVKGNVPLVLRMVCPMSCGGLCRFFDRSRRQPSGRDGCFVRASVGVLV